MLAAFNGWPNGCKKQDGTTANNGRAIIDCVNCCHSFEKSYARFSVLGVKPSPVSFSELLLIFLPLKVMIMGSLSRFRCPMLNLASIAFTGLTFMSGWLLPPLSHHRMALAIDLNPLGEPGNNVPFTFIPLSFTSTIPFVCVKLDSDWACYFQSLPNPICLLSHRNFFRIRSL